MSDHAETLETLLGYNASRSVILTDKECEALRAAIALMRGQSEYSPAGFVVDGPSAFVFAPTRDLIEPRIRAVCFENGDDPDDYTATEVFVRLTNIPAAPKEPADEQ